MLLSKTALGLVALSLGGVQSTLANAPTITDLDRVYLVLEGLREKCLVEELPAKTVVLGITKE